VQAALLVLVLGLGVPLLDLYGTVGMAAAWLAAQTMIALALGAWFGKEIRAVMHFGRKARGDVASGSPTESGLSRQAARAAK
jgi:hypothetical protein